MDTTNPETFDGPVGKNRQSLEVERTSNGDQEPKDSGEQARAIEEGDIDGSEDARTDDSALHSTLDRVRPRENLRHCTLCGENDILKEEFRQHIQRQHPAPKQEVPTGYYACWSGAGFWYPLGPVRGPCKWICSVCGEVHWYYGRDKAHGGPPDRLLDRRYGLEYCRGKRYPGHKRYLGKIDGAAGQVVFYHEGAPNPPQPDQTDEQILSFVKPQKGKDAKSIPGRAKRVQGSEGDKQPAGRVPTRGRRVNVEEG